MPGPTPSYPSAWAPWQRGGPPSPSQRAAHPGPCCVHSDRRRRGQGPGSSWGAGEKASPVPGVVQEDDPNGGRNVIQEVKVLFGDPEVLPSLRVTLRVSAGRRPPPGGSRSARTSPGTAAHGRDPARRARGSAPSLPAAPPRTHRPRPAVSLPARRWCGPARPRPGPFAAGLQQEPPAARRPPAERSRSRPSPPLSDEMGFRSAGADPCPQSGPLQGARGTPVPAERTGRSRMLPKHGSQGPDLLSSSGLRPVFPGPSRLAPVAADPVARFACSVPLGQAQPLSASGHKYCWDACS